MFKVIDNNTIYHEWLDKAAGLESPYDYFDFATQFKDNIGSTNTVYSSLLTDFADRAKNKNDVIHALKKFKDRKREGTEFKKQYDDYWKKRGEEEGASSALKRRVEAMLRVNNDICEEVEAISKKSKSNTIESINKTVHSINNEIEDNSVLDIDHLGVSEIAVDFMEPEELEEAKQATNLTNYELTHYCNLLLSKIESSTSSSIALRRIIRKSVIPENETFDLIEYEDVNFVEVLGVHFLNLMDSPNNPLTQKNLERNVAIQTTIVILNSLFLTSNDIIDLKWLEKETMHTGSSKWDGVGFGVRDNKLVPLLVEFSGGIQYNCTVTKKTGDENKMIKGMKAIIQYNRVTYNDGGMPIPVFYVRFFGGEIFFEALHSIDHDNYTKRSYFSVRCPTTPNGLKLFFKKTHKMFSWKKTVIKHIRRLTDEETNNN